MVDLITIKFDYNQINQIWFIRDNNNYNKSLKSIPLIYSKSNSH
jgi:hypothetical protein